LKKFNGDLVKWATFWDTFESSVHTNSQLSDIDKFNYLKSLLEGPAYEAISGLKLTATNYSEALAVLKKRFGNKKHIIDKHMQTLVNIEAVTSQHNIKGLRRFYDLVESQVRGLRSLGVLVGSYGALLATILLDKLPSELQLIISREAHDEEWELDNLMKVLEREIDARERAFSLSNRVGKGTSGRNPPTATSLLSQSGESHAPKCCYCKQSHSSNSCQVVTDVSQRKQILRKAGRCFVCLRRNHMSRECRSTLKCARCGGRHHVTICNGLPERALTTTVEQVNHPQPSITSTAQMGTNIGVTPTTLSLHCVSTKVPVLLQTARADVFRVGNPQIRKEARIVFDSGSQRSYITRDLASALSLSSGHFETMMIKTFGSQTELRQVCGVVMLGLMLKNGRSLKLSFLSVPLICEPLTNQPITHVKESYAHLASLDLADHASGDDTLNVDILIGSDNYWSLVTGRVIRGDRGGPTAIQTKLGWVLAGPVEGLSCLSLTNLVTTHLMAVDAYVSQDGDHELDCKLKMFWDLESLGIKQNEATVYDEFENSIRFNGDRYEVSLPWKDSHAPLPDNYNLSVKRLVGLLKRLRQNPEILEQYDAVIREQIDKGIVEFVKVQALTKGPVHYLPHHAILREDKSTTKLRVVYDASARTGGPSLNDCLYTGPKSGQRIMDILLRFRVHKVAMVADIEKAFLMVSVREEDRDVLRFLWVKDLKAASPEISVLRFTRVVFGVSASPFLLNATIRHHMEQYSASHPEVISMFMRSIYVDDVSYGADDDNSAFELFLKSKEILAQGGFNLRKFVTNSSSLSCRVGSLDQGFDATVGDSSHKVIEEDKGYTRDILGDKKHTDGEQKILGVRWNFIQDDLVFDLSELATLMKNTEATKRQIVGITTRFYDPLGFMSPVMIRIKVFFQELCMSKVEWDEPLTGQLLNRWDTLVSNFKSIVTSLPRCYQWSVGNSSNKCSLHGFCDASCGAYAAVVYIKVETDGGSSTSFVTSKTRVAPVNKQTIPRLELLSALLLANLINVTVSALRQDLEIDSVVCYTDSKVALFWIKGLTKEWKPFIQNRVNTIRKLVPADNWKHCPGEDNPADLPSRGVTPTELVGSTLWRHGPSWLTLPEPRVEEELAMPDECMNELKARQSSTEYTILAASESHGISQVMQCNNFSTLQRLFRVTAYVMRFCRVLKMRSQSEDGCMPSSAELTASEITAAELIWIKEAQRSLKEDKLFNMWQKQFGLFLVEGVWQCKGRIGNADLPCTTRYPVLLPKEHYLATLIVQDAHNRVMHNGVKETLTEIRSKYWVIRGRQFVRRVLHKCVVCRKYEGRSYSLPPPPQLPEFRVKEMPPFTYTGVDFAGPLYIETQGLCKKGKVWICLFTCCVVRAVHLEIVPDLTASSFLKCFKRFTARRGIPSKVVSDNGKTFKAAARYVRSLFDHPKLQCYTSNAGIEWSFNLEKAPWWGGIFERMIKSVKRCLRKTIGRARVTYDELITAITEVEGILNSRPLSYVSTEDFEEPLTPSHLLIGHRALSLPNPTLTGRGTTDDLDESQESLSRRAKHLCKVMEHFWKRWRTEYLLQLRESHRYSKGTTSGQNYVPRQGELVLLHDERNLRGFWKLAKIEELLKGSDGRVRGAMIRVPSRSSSTILRRPLSRLYPLEIQCRPTAELDEPSSSSQGAQVDEEPQQVQDAEPRTRPRRVAAQRANEWMKALVRQLK